jgi:hypothetical protein
VWVALMVMVAVLAAAVEAQSRRQPAQRAPAKPAAPAMKKEPARVTCPSALGDGLTSGRSFCDVLSGRNAEEGLGILLPAHTGVAVLTFDLHNRHTYSEEQVRAGRAFAEYTATVGLLTPNNDLLSRAVVRSAFRTEADLFDRVGGGAGPGGVKAVAPVGSESVRVEVPADVTELRLLGERLVVERLDGREVFTAPGRPVALVSRVEVEYRPAARTPARPAVRRSGP